MCIGVQAVNMKIVMKAVVPGFHIAVRCYKAATGIAETIAAGMPLTLHNHFNSCGNHFSRYCWRLQASWLQYRNELEKFESFQLFLNLMAYSAMKFYIEVNRLPVAAIGKPLSSFVLCLIVFILSLSYWYCNES